MTYLKHTARHLAKQLAFLGVFDWTYFNSNSFVLNLPIQSIKGVKSKYFVIVKQPPNVPW